MLLQVLCCADGVGRSGVLRVRPDVGYTGYMRYFCVKYCWNFGEEEEGGDMLCARGGGGGYVSGLVHTTCDDYDDGYKMMSANKILN